MFCLSSFTAGPSVYRILGFLGIHGCLSVIGGDSPMWSLFSIGRCFSLVVALSSGLLFSLFILPHHARPSQDVCHIWSAFSLSAIQLAFHGPARLRAASHIHV